MKCDSYHFANCILNDAVANAMPNTQQPLLSFVSVVT